MFALAYHILSILSSISMLGNRSSISMLGNRSSISMLGTWFVLFRPFGLFDKIGESNG